MSTEGHLRTCTLVSSLISQQDMSKQSKSEHALDLVGSYPPSQQDISGQFKSDHALDLIRSDPGIQAVINLAEGGVGIFRVRVRRRVRALLPPPLPSSSSSHFIKLLAFHDPTSWALGCVRWGLGDKFQFFCLPFWIFFLGLSCRGAFGFAQCLRCVCPQWCVSSIAHCWFCRSFYVCANTVVLVDCFFSISDDDMYHANSDWVWRQAIRTAWGNRWCVVSPERVSIVVVFVDDDPTSRLVSQTFAVAAYSFRLLGAWELMLLFKLPWISETIVADDAIQILELSSPVVLRLVLYDIQ